jgi:small subunit ribosomal protein S19e
MASIYDVNAEKLIKKAAEELKKDIKMPEWAKFVKTGAGKERPPVEKDFWYIRAASILRKIYISGPIGVEKLRKKYSAKKNRGYKPERVYLSSGKIIRTILQDLEKNGYIKFGEKKVHKGRIITAKGKKFLDNLSKNLK